MGEGRSKEEKRASIGLDMMIMITCPKCDTKYFAYLGACPKCGTEKKR